MKVNPNIGVVGPMCIECWCNIVVMTCDFSCFETSNVDGSRGWYGSISWSSLFTNVTASSALMSTEINTMIAIKYNIFILHIYITSQLDSNIQCAVQQSLNNQLQYTLPVINDFCHAITWLLLKRKICLWPHMQPCICTIVDFIAKYFWLAVTYIYSPGRYVLGYKADFKMHLISMMIDSDMLLFSKSSLYIYQRWKTLPKECRFTFKSIPFPF